MKSNEMKRPLLSTCYCCRLVAGRDGYRFATLVPQQWAPLNYIRFNNQ